MCQMELERGGADALVEKAREVSVGFEADFVLAAPDVENQGFPVVLPA